MKDTSGNMHLSELCLNNVHAELYKMVCSDNETFTDITIPSIMLPKAAGNDLEDALNLNEEGKVTPPLRLFFMNEKCRISCTKMSTYCCYNLVVGSRSPLSWKKGLSIVYWHQLLGDSDYLCCWRFYSESVTVLSKENARRHSRSVFVVDGCGHHLECLVLVGLDCKRSCARALPSPEGIMLPTPHLVLSYFICVASFMDY